MNTKLTKILCVFMSVILFAGIFAGTNISFAAASGDFEYVGYGNGTCEITDYTGTASELTIPDTIDGYSVTRIGDFAFYDNYSLKSVQIPYSVTSIGEGAFSYCYSLTSISVPDSVTSIGESAFNVCESLNSITIPDGVNIIGKSTFSNCDSLTSVTIPDSVTSIGESAFSGCESLVSFTIPNNVTSIGAAAFRNCDSLIEITIPHSVTNIGSFAFGDCDSLTMIIVDKNNKEYFSDEYGVLFNKSKTTLLQYPTGNTRKNYTIPDSVKTIGVQLDALLYGYSAFKNCLSLTEITISRSVERIISGTFSGCTNLKTVNYKGTHQEWNNINIGSDNEYLIYANINFLGIEEPSSEEDSTEELSSEETTTEEITTQEYTTEVFPTEEPSSEVQPHEIFKYTVLDDGTAEITGLRVYPSNNLVVPETIKGYTVTSIGEYAFYDYHILKSVQIPDSVTNIGDYAFSRCTSLTSVIIPNSVTSIGDYAFNICESLASVNIPDSVQKIGAGAFSFCRSLTEITIPDSVQKIGAGAFAACGLTSIIIPASVKNIGPNVFNLCDRLQSIIVDKNNTAYTSDEFGVLFNKNKTKLMQYPISNTREEYTIPDSVLNVAINSFYGCENLKSLNVSNSLKSVSEYAFSECKNLETVNYSGTEQQWYSIFVCVGNTDFTFANVIFNGVEEPETEFPTKPATEPTTEPVAESTTEESTTQPITTGSENVSEIKRFLESLWNIMEKIKNFLVSLFS